MTADTFTILDVQHFIATVFFSLVTTKISIHLYPAKGIYDVLPFSNIANIFVTGVKREPTSLL